MTFKCHFNNSQSVKITSTDDTTEIHKLPTTGLLQQTWFHCHSLTASGNGKINIYN